jgi:hypothetical protein
MCRLPQPPWLIGGVLTRTLAAPLARRQHALPGVSCRFGPLRPSRSTTASRSRQSLPKATMGRAITAPKSLHPHLRLYRPRGHRRWYPLVRRLRHPRGHRLRHPRGHRRWFPLVRRLRHPRHPPWTRLHGTTRPLQARARQRRRRRRRRRRARTICSAETICRTGPRAGTGLGTTKMGYCTTVRLDTAARARNTRSNTEALQARNCIVGRVAARSAWACTRLAAGPNWHGARIEA